MYQALRDWLSSGLFIAAAVAGFAFLLRDLAGRGDSRGRELLTIFLLSSLAGAIGIEGITTQRALRERVEMLDLSIQRSSSVTRLQGNDEVFGSAMRLIDSAKRRIRSLIFVRGPVSKAPDAFVDRVATKLAGLKAAGTPGRFDLILVLDGDHPPEGFVEATKERLARYAVLGVTPYMGVHVLSQTPPIGLDLLAVDITSVNLGLASIPKNNTLPTALSFEQDPEITRELVEWFDNIILPKAVPFDEWLESIRKGH